MSSSWFDNHSLECPFVVTYPFLKVYTVQDFPCCCSPSAYLLFPLAVTNISSNPFFLMCPPYRVHYTLHIFILPPKRRIKKTLGQQCRPNKLDNLHHCQYFVFFQYLFYLLHRQTHFFCNFFRRHSVLIAGQNFPIHYAFFYSFFYSFFYAFFF